jgi:transcription-repair coupling factor (superfamily II helicase)
MSPGRRMTACACLYAGDDNYSSVENIEVLLVRLRGCGYSSTARWGRLAVAQCGQKRIRDIADELIRVAAERQLRPGDVLHFAGGIYEEFAARFPYPETEDQLTAIADTLADIASGKPMDRLICGDVGFGKTKVALRAAFIAAMAGSQVAVVVPTTLLARQHFRSFSERFAGLPLRIGLVRLVAAKEAREVKKARRGPPRHCHRTHALLAAMSFAHLGLSWSTRSSIRGRAKAEAAKADVRC